MSSTDFVTEHFVESLPPHLYKDAVVDYVILAIHLCHLHYIVAYRIGSYSVGVRLGGTRLIVKD